MNKKTKIFFALGLVFAGMQPGNAFAADKPVVVSFTMTPDSVDVASASAVVSFDLTVSNPTGIYTSQSLVTLTDGANHTLSTMMVRADSPVNSALSTVKFHGSVTVPQDLPNGVYTASATPISSLTAGGSSGYATDTLYPTSMSKVVGAEDSLQVRKSGDLNYAYSTIVGPAYDKTLGNSFVNPKFNYVAAPIWKVGESFNPADYFELEVPTLALKIKTNTPSICTSQDGKLNLIATGACSFTVYTDKTLDYQAYKVEQTVTITAARIKPTYVVGTIPTQSSATLPLLVTGPTIYGPLGLVLPVSTTSSVCYTAGVYINVISGGTCTITYSSPADSSYQASDVYPLTFQISRNSQSVSFTAPATVNLASKNLSLVATASSGAPVLFQSDSPSICSVTGNSLNLLKAGACQVQALQAGTTTIAPASANQTITVVGSEISVKKIVCVKNGKTKLVQASKCPSGFKIKK